MGRHDARLLLGLVAINLIRDRAMCERRVIIALLRLSIEKLFQLRAAIPPIFLRLSAREPRLTALPGGEILPNVPLNLLSFVIAALFCPRIDETTLERIPVEHPPT
jgi:hypothetical protein